MSKIICEVCGTRYPDTAEQCPICGFIKENTDNEPEQEVQEEVFVVPERPAVPGGRFSKRNVRKRLKNQEAYAEAEERSRVADKAEEYETREEDEEDEEESSGKGSTVLNVVLVLVIIALLATSALIFVKYFMPGFLDKEPEVQPTESYVEQTEAPTEAPTEALTEAPSEEPTEAPTVPCLELVLEETNITLREVGAMHLLNIQILPEDTTDTIMYVSSNEAVATVNEEGRITAVAEGSVVITVVCGEQQLECNVVCNFSAEEETEAPTEEAAEAGVKKTVTSNYVNIRSGAGTGYEKVGQYKQGDVVTIYEEKTVGGRPWGRTDDGWICTEYVK